MSNPFAPPSCYAPTSGASSTQRTRGRGGGAPGARGTGRILHFGPPGTFTPPAAPAGALRSARAPVSPPPHLQTPMPPTPMQAAEPLEASPYRFESPRAHVPADSPALGGGVVRASDLDDDDGDASDGAERISRAELGLHPTLVCERLACSALFETRGGLALRLSAERRGLRDDEVCDVLLELRRVSQALYGAHVRAQGERGLKAGWRVVLDVCCEENFGALTDAGIERLCAGLASLRAVVQPRILRLHANAIGDRGARALAGLLAQSTWPVEELHLSHNRIGNDGFHALLAAALAGGYPRLDSRAGGGGGGGGAAFGARVPLWLRLEFNLLEVGGALAQLEPRARAALCVLDGGQRGPGPTQCDVRHCRRNGGCWAKPLCLGLACVHLPYLACQKMLGARLLSAPAAGGAPPPRALAGPVGVAVASADEGAAASEAGAARTAADGGSGVAVASADEGAAASEAGAARAAADGGSGEGGGEGEAPSLWLLCDTNVILALTADGSGGAFAFERLLAAARGGRAVLGGCVRLVLIETVRQQLEALKQQTHAQAGRGGGDGQHGAQHGAHAAAHAARTFFSKQLLELSSRGILWYMDTAQVEDVARANTLCAAEVPAGRADGRRDMDGRIIDCGLAIGAQLRAGARVLLLTDDKELLARALNHGLAAESLRALLPRLGRSGAGAAEPYTAECVTSACAQSCRALLDAGARAAASVAGPYTELNCAAELAGRAAQLLAAASPLLAASEPETASSLRAQMLETAAELSDAAARWARLADAKRTDFQRQGQVSSA